MPPINGATAAAARGGDDAAPSSAASIESERILSSVSCRVHVDALFYCLSPANQLSTYYRAGAVDDCVAPTRRLQACFFMRMTDDDEKRVRLHKQLDVSGADSPSASVWRLRSDPAKDWRA